MGVKTFFVKDSGLQRVSLRRYRGSDVAKCPKTGYYCDATVPFEIVPETFDANDFYVAEAAMLPKEDPHWEAVAKCTACGYQFTDQDSRQMFQESIYVDANGKQWILPRSTKAVEAAGLMYDAWWFRRKREPDPSDPHMGSDGMFLICYTPDGWPWSIDSRASNCTSPCKNCNIPYRDHNTKNPNCRYEDSRPHKCWVRHGVPPNITVDKGGVTCAAGAGSILSGNGYHGFLRNGEFT